MVMAIFRKEIEGEPTPKKVAEILASMTELDDMRVRRFRSAKVKRYHSSTMLEVTCDVDSPDYPA